MEGMDWILLAAAVAAVGGIVWLQLKGCMSANAATRCIGAVVELVRRAEALWKDYRGAGAQKKAWVLEQLRALGGRCGESILGLLIDAVVAWLNAAGWK